MTNTRPARKVKPLKDPREVAVIRVLEAKDYNQSEALAIISLIVRSDPETAKAIVDDPYAVVPPSAWRNKPVPTRKQLGFSPRYSVLRKTHGHCTYCDVPLLPEHEGGLEFTVDHGIPLSGGGTDDIGNLFPACPYCNHAKGEMTRDEFWVHKNGGELA